MIILSCDEKPVDWETKEYRTAKLELGSAKSAVMWYTDEEDKAKSYKVMHNQEFREAIDIQVPRWHVNATMQDNPYPIKYASVEFWTTEGHFVIYPGDIGSDITECQFELIRGDIIETLTCLGAVRIWYTGMLD